MNAISEPLYVFIGQKPFVDFCYLLLQLLDFHIFQKQHFFSSFRIYKKVNKEDLWQSRQEQRLPTATGSFFP